VLQINSAERLAGLTLGGGGVLVRAGGANTLLTKSLSITGTGRLDLADNAMVLDYSGATQADAVRQQLFAARNGGGWTGASGIFASGATAGGKAVGYIEASDLGVSSWGGQPVDATAVVLKPTYYGDANMSGRVDGDDYALLDHGMLMQRTGWVNGDFNYDNVIDGADAALINAAASQPAPGQVLTAAAPVPAPVSDAGDGSGQAVTVPDSGLFIVGAPGSTVMRGTKLVLKAKGPAAAKGQLVWRVYREGRLVARGAGSTLRLTAAAAGRYRVVLAVMDEPAGPGATVTKYSTS
jgi:hypothetical protein